VEEDKLQLGEYTASVLRGCVEVFLCGQGRLDPTAVRLDLAALFFFSYSLLK